MDAMNVAVSVEDQFPAVSMTLPFGNHLHINAALDCARDEHSAQRTLTEWRELQPATRTGQSFFPIANLQDRISVGFVFAQPFEKQSNLRENRNSKARRCLMSKCDDSSGIKIDIGARERTSLRLS